MAISMTVIVTVDATRVLPHVHGAGQVRFLRAPMLNVTMKMTMTSIMTFEMTMTMNFNIKWPSNYRCNCHSDFRCYTPPSHPRGPPSPLPPRPHAQCHI